MEMFIDQSDLTLRSYRKNQLIQLRALCKMFLSGRKTPAQFVRDHWLIAGFLDLETQPNGFDYLELTRQLNETKYDEVMNVELWTLVTQMEHSLREIIFLS